MCNENIFPLLMQTNLVYFYWKVSLIVLRGGIEFCVQFSFVDKQGNIDLKFIIFKMKFMQLRIS
jgi:hypothetical protein